MPSFDLPDDRYRIEDEHLRTTTPPVRRGFLLVLAVLTVLAAVVYGVPYVAFQMGMAYEAGRAQAASEALRKLDKEKIIDRASDLFRMATNATAPAVVNIRTEGGGPRLQGELSSLGSGVVVDKRNGYIVTNYHVVRDARRVRIRFSRGSDLEARIVGVDPKTDLAVLQVQGPLQVEAKWGDSSKLNIGDWVLAIGSPFALDRTVTAGIISATGRSNLRLISDNSYEEFLQTDAAINPGNSGGPLIDLRGTVVGINTAIYSENGGNQGIGLAIPASIARSVVEQLIANKRVIRGYLGVILQPVDSELAEQLKVEPNRGAAVVTVQPGSPAARAGMRVGDLVTKLGDWEVEGVESLRNRIAQLAVGGKVQLEIIREGKVERLVATIEEFPAVTSLGLTVRDRTPQESGSKPIGVIIQRVEGGSMAERAGLQAGMWVVGVAGKPIRDAAEYEKSIASYDAFTGVPLVVRLQEDGSDRDVNLIVGGMRPRRR